MEDEEEKRRPLSRRNIRKHEMFLEQNYEMITDDPFVDNYDSEDDDLKRYRAAKQGDFWDANGKVIEKVPISANEHRKLLKK